MITRILPPREWPRLAGTELGDAWEHLSPKDVSMLVVEQDGVIVGCWCVLRYVHVEGLWIHPDHRKRGSVGRRLLRGMRQAARELGARFVFTGALGDDVRGLIAHIGGTKLPGEAYVIPVGEA